MIHSWETNISPIFISQRFLMLRSIILEGATFTFLHWKKEVLLLVLLDVYWFPKYMWCDLLIAILVKIILEYCYFRLQPYNYGGRIITLAQKLPCPWDLKYWTFFFSSVNFFLMIIIRMPIQTKRMGSWENCVLVLTVLVDCGILGHVSVHSELQILHSLKDCNSVPLRESYNRMKYIVWL